MFLKRAQDECQEGGEQRNSLVQSVSVCVHVCAACSERRRYTFEKSSNKQRNGDKAGVSYTVPLFKLH